MNRHRQFCLLVKFFTSIVVSSVVLGCGFMANYIEYDSFDTTEPLSEYTKESKNVVPWVAIQNVGPDGWLLNIDSRNICSHDRWAHAEKVVVSRVRPQGRGGEELSFGVLIGLDLLWGSVSTLLAAGVYGLYISDQSRFTQTAAVVATAVPGGLALAYFGSAAVTGFKSMNKISTYPAPDVLVFRDTGQECDHERKVLVAVQIGTQTQTVQAPGTLLITPEESEALFGTRPTTVITATTQEGSGASISIELQASDVPPLAAWQVLEREREETQARSAAAVQQSAAAARASADRETSANQVQACITRAWDKVCSLVSLDEQHLCYAAHDSALYKRVASDCAE